MLKGSAFPLEAGLNQLSTGSFELIKGIRAYEDSIVVVTSPNGSAFTATIMAGEDREVYNCQSLAITSGLVSLCRRTVA